MSQPSKILTAAMRQRGCYGVARPAQPLQHQAAAPPPAGRHRKPPWYIRWWMALHHDR
ncbi:hypothetical protein [Roseateles violae]|uniref:Uncharacterized protein n=1 Tax=Roseateles violae TaxID=3058042 RepID=A0ABT8DWF2_9BURK|nr:hypothetical protein [Pelomonas sp. PFR6]MDN3920624.1 hypothetical protein [Pelomonas sp. PFR6]